MKLGRAGLRVQGERCGGHAIHGDLTLRCCPAGHSLSFGGLPCPILDPALVLETLALEKLLTSRSASNLVPSSPFLPPFPSLSLSISVCPTGPCVSAWPRGALSVTLQEGRTWKSHHNAET